MEDIMAQSLIRLLFVTAAAQFFIATAAADELWTYYFIADSSRPYFRECYGDCAVSGTSADLAGEFSVLLDWNAGTGKLVALDDQLVNVAILGGNSSTGPLVIPTVPPSQPHGLFRSGVVPEFATGQLTSVGDHWQLTSGVMPLPGSGGVAGMPYNITFSLNSAALSLAIGQQFLGIPLGVTRVTNAPATFVSKSQAGDFNFDGRIDASDYIAWRATSGSQVDYNTWRANFGAGIVGGAALPTANVPEPSNATLALLLLGSIALYRR
jgi:hypothetical protein